MNTKDKPDKEELIYFNDEWNGYRYVNLHMFHIISTELNKTIKNNKPDGRRYKK